MEKKIIIKIGSDTTELTGSLNTIKANISELRSELDNTPIGTQRFQDLTDAIASAEDQMKSFGKTSEQVAKEQQEATAKAAAAANKALQESKQRAVQIGENFAKVGAGIAGAFSVATGVVGAFGDSLGFTAEEVEGAQKKAAAFVGILTGIKPVIEGAQAGFALFNKVLEKNPILAVTTAILALGAAITAFIFSQKEAVKTQEELNEEYEKSLQLTKEIITESEKGRNARKGGLNDLERELKLLEAKGATEEEILEKEREILNEKVQGFKNEVSTFKFSLQDKSISQEQYNDFAVDLQQRYYDATTEFDVKAAEREKSIRDKNLEDYKQYLEKRIDVQRIINELNISLIVDDIERAIAEENERYRIFVEDTKNDTKLLATERATILKLAEEQLSKNIQKIRDAARKEEEEKKKADFDKLIASYEQFDVFERSLIKNNTDKKIADEQAALEKRLSQLDEFYKNGIISLEEYNQKEKELLEQSAKTQKQIQKEARDKEKTDSDEKAAAREKAIEEIKQTAIATILAFNDVLTQLNENKINELDKQEEVALQNENLSEEEKVSIQNKFAKKRDEIARKEFNRSKAVKVAEAIMTTYQSASAAYASQLTIPSLDAPIRATIAAGVAIAFGTAQVAKILATKFQESTPSVAGTGGGASSISGSGGAATPSFNLFGKGNDFNQGGPGGSRSSDTNAPLLVKAVVSETDLVDTSHRLSTIRQASEL